MAKGRFASTGVVVGQTPASQWGRKLQHQKSNKVTMGFDVPRQTEGAVGDITVREVNIVGLVCYIKTNSGWFDINTLSSLGSLNWKRVTYHATANWEDYDSDNKVVYAKDANGFVHLRGQGKTASSGDAGANDTIFTLPSGARPITSFSCVVVTGALVYDDHSTLRIQADGRADVISPADTAQSAARVVFDGISFFAGQTVIGSGGGSGSKGEGGGHGGGGGGGGGGGA